MILAMSLRIVPFPHLVRVLNPDWVLLVMIYWTLALPYRKGIFTAWSIGLLTDVLTGRLLGEYALIYTLITYCSIALHKQLRQFPLVQQSLFIFACLLTAKLLTFIIETMKGSPHFSVEFWYPVASGTLLWSFVHPTLHFIRSLGRSHR
jgi:rod shape-determining protein MreD